MTNNTTAPVAYLTVAEVAKLLRLSRMTVYRMVSTGSLESIRTGVNGKSIRILRSSVREHLHVPGQTSISA